MQQLKAEYEASLAQYQKRFSNWSKKQTKIVNRIIK